MSFPVIDKKSNFGQALWLSIGYTCSMLVGILSSAILSRYFDKAEYGTYRQVMYVYHIFTTIFVAGFPAAFTYFLPRLSKEEGKSLVKKIDRILFLLGVFCSAALFLGSDLFARLLNNPELSTALKLFSVFPLFTMPAVGVEGIYTVNKRTEFVAIYNIVTRLMMLLCIVLPVVLIKNDYRYALVGWGVASFIGFIIAIIAKNRVYKNIESLPEAPNLIGDVVKYISPVIVSSIVTMFLTSANQFFISRYFGVVSFAEYSNGYFTLPFAVIFISPVRSILTPIFAKSSLNGEYSNALSTLYVSTKKIVSLVLPLVVFAFVFAEDIMVFLYGAKYANSYVFFRLVLCFNFIEMFPFSGIMAAIGKTKQLMYFDVICTCILWSVDFLLIRLNVASPLMITAIFIVLNTMTKYLIPAFYLWLKLGIKVIDRNTIAHVLKTGIHVIIALGCVFLISKYSLGSLSPFIRLTVALFIFYVLLLVSAKVFKLDYITPILQNFTKKNNNPS